VTGVPVELRVLAGFSVFLPRMWDAVRPNLATRDFEDAADQLRASAVEAAARMDRLAAGVPLGESETYRLRGLLDLHHYVSPKLLLLAATVRAALDGALLGPVVENMGAIEQVERGAPPAMHALEMVAERPEDATVRELLADIEETLELPAASGDWRSLALFPDYLAAFWARLRPVALGDAWRGAGRALGQEARSLALGLPHPVPLSRERLANLGEDLRGVYRATDDLERILPGVVLDVALASLEWSSPGDLAESPFPAATRRPAGFHGAPAA
jgi:hypothetical protein